MPHRGCYESDEEGVVILRVQVRPRAPKNAIVGPHGDALKVRIAAVPEGGRANDALVSFLAEEFGIAPRDVEVISGLGSRSKRVRLRGVPATRLEELLA